MLLLIWCGALCSFTDPSLWLLHSRSPPAPPPQMIVSTRALLSVRLYVPQSVHAGWPLPNTSFCSVWLPCPPFLLSNASLFTCHVFLSFSRCLSLLFFVHLLSFPWPPQWSVCPRWLQHGAFPNWLGQGPFPIPTPTKLPIWCPPHIWLPTPSSTHSPGSDTLLLPVRCPWWVGYMGDVNRFQVVHPPRLCHLFETSPLWVVCLRLIFTSRASLFSLCKTLFCQSVLVFGFFVLLYQNWPDRTLRSHADVFSGLLSGLRIFN